jgi:outer membrane biosynthesis protein TonB
MDRLDVASNGAGLAGVLTLLALALTMGPQTTFVAPADPGGQTEIALDLPVEAEAAEPPPPEPPQETPIEAPQPQILEETPSPSDAPAPIAARPRPQKLEKPKPKVDEHPRRERSDDSKADAKKEAREKPTAVRRGEAGATERTSHASGNVSAFRACLAGAPYPSSKDARLQKPSGAVGIAVSGGSASVTSSSGSAILDAAARSRAVACASAAGGGALSGVVVFHPR